jgi:erythronate-4-phosphate dehydrogenase
MEADIVTLHVPLTRLGPDATYHLFDEDRIRKMKRNSILINTSRGGIVETEALKRTLVDGYLLTAVLDVWEKEPNIDVALLEHASLGTPHIAGYSLDGKMNALRMNYEAVCRFLSKSIEQEINKLVPDPALPEIKIKTIQSPIEQLLRNVVKNCYDINLDDRLLRHIISLEKQERGKYFSKLRAEYRVRREFFNAAVSLSDKAKNIAELLQQLGFNVKY